MSWPIISVVSGAVIVPVRSAAAGSSATVPIRCRAVAATGSVERRRRSEAAGEAQFCRKGKKEKEEIK